MNLTILFFYIFFIFLIGALFFYLSPKIGLVDIPNNRKNHIGKIPLIGGIVGGISILFFSLILVNNEMLILIIASSFIILTVGFLDDIYDLHFSYRLVTQFIIILFIIGNGISITTLGYYSKFGSFEIGAFGILLTFLSISALTNSLNFIDGSDGLCAGIILTSFIGILIVSKNNIVADLEFFYLITIFLVIFLFFNIFGQKYKIFLGDSGSTFFGFILSVSLIYFTSSENNYFHQSLVPWLVFIPICDILRVTFNRIKRGKNPFLPDKTHIHHIMLNINLNKLQIFTIIIFLQIFSISIGYFLLNNFGAEISLLLFPVFFILYFFVMSKIDKNN